MSGEICEEDSKLLDPLEEENPLHKRQTEMLLLIHKLELILDTLKNTNANDLNVSDKERVQKMIKILAIQDHIQLSETDNVLGLETVNSLPLTYTERKALKEHLFFKIREVCPPVVEYIEKMEKKIPNLFEVGAHTREILRLEEKRRGLQNELIKIKNNKVELLRMCTEKKLAPHERKSLQLLLAEYKLNLIKVETLQGLLVQEYCTRTQYTLKAIKEVERYIDEELKKIEE